MTDPREFSDRKDPNRFTPDLGEPERADGEQRNPADGLAADADELPPADPGDLPPVGDEVGPDADELDADNPVEEDSIETLDPENPPA